MIQEGPPPVALSLRTLTGRNPIGWIVLILFFVLAIASALVGSTSETGSRARAHKAQQDLLAGAMQHKWFQLNTARKSKSPWIEQADPQFKKLDPQIQQMWRLAVPGDDPMAAKLYLAMSYERGRKIDPVVLSSLGKSKRPVDKDVSTIYASTSMSRSLAQELVNRLPDSPAVYKAVKVHALEKAGVKDAMSLYKANNRNVTLVGLLFAGMVTLWVPVILLCSLLMKAYPVRGIPMAVISPRGADRLATHAAVIFACFQLISIGAFFLPWPPAWSSLVAGLVLLVAIVLFQYLRLDGIKVSLAELGVSAANLKTNIGIGVLGFLAEFPVSILLADLGEWIFKFLPAPTHPASQTLQATHRFSVVFPLVLFGSLIAPFWEELTFRGLLFPALNRFMGLVPSIVVSSLLFGLIHPQGPALVLSLASVGVASCIASYRSKSLVPSIVIHCLHNSAVFALTLLIT